jgi:hypothetical protein
MSDNVHESRLEGVSEQTPLDEILASKPEPERAEAPQRQEESREWIQNQLREEQTKKETYRKHSSSLEERIRSLEEENKILWDGAYAAPPSDDEAAELRWQAKVNAASVDFVRKFGADALDDLERAMTKAAKDGHPDMPAVIAAMRESGNPAAVAAGWANHVGIFDRDGQYAERFRTMGSPPRQRQRDVVMPSNLAGQRSVAPRTGPAWTGPTPLNDIFKR